MASKSDLIRRSGRSPRLEGRTASIQPTDAAACRLFDVLVSALALIALALTAWGAVTPGHF